mgnify:CR=1 FL=1
MRTYILFVLVWYTLWQMGCLAAFAAPAPKTVRKPIEQPSGEWTVISIESEGAAPITEKEFLLIKTKMCLRKNEIVVLKDDTRIASEPVAFFDNGGQLEIDICIDDSKRLKKGIYKIAGDLLIICASEPGNERPTNFTAPKGSKKGIMTLKRNEK